MKDRIPPAAVESEQAIIGCCLCYPVESMPQIEAVLTPSFFYDARCQVVWESLRGFSPSEINIISLRRSLSERGMLDKIGDNFLSDCQNKAVSSEMLPVWIGEVKTKESLRELISTCSHAIDLAFGANGNADELIDSIERDILAIRPQKTDDNTIKTLIAQAIDRIEHKCLSDGSITGLSTGLIDLDRLTDGLHKSEMIVLAALPSRGKTALAVNIAVLNALKGVPAAIMSAEMRPVQLVVRSICSESRTNFHRVSVQDIPKMTVAAAAISKAPLFIEQASGFTIGQVRAIGRRLKQKHDIQLMVIDYQQRLTGIGDNTEQRTASISKGVKDLCMELNIPIILLSQVNEAGQTKHARATTEDCDSLWKLSNIGEWQPELQEVSLSVEKCRDGSTGNVSLNFFKEYTRFECLSKVDDKDVPR